MAQMKEDLLALEEMVDKHGLKAVLNALATICFEKEEHVGSAWQDAGLAERWAWNGHCVSIAEAKVDNIP